MSRVKLKRFALNAERPDVVEPGKETYKQLGGRWRADFFRAEPATRLTLEVGCGKGDYTVGLAERFPDELFLGFDLKGERIWTGATRAQELGLRNVGWLRGMGHELPEQFAPGELSAIWVTFPDPRPKLSDAKRRLTSPRFMAIYRQLLAPDGTLHFKTDDAALFDYTLQEVVPTLAVQNLRATDDLYGAAGELVRPLAHGIQTHYERRFLAAGKRIHYLEFSFAPAEAGTTGHEVAGQALKAAG